MSTIDMPMLRLPVVLQAQLEGVRQHMRQLEVAVAAAADVAGVDGRNSGGPAANDAGTGSASHSVKHVDVAVVVELVPGRA